MECLDDLFEVANCRDAVGEAVEQQLGVLGVPLSQRRLLSLLEGSERVIELAELGRVRGLGHHTSHHSPSGCCFAAPKARSYWSG